MPGRASPLSAVSWTQRGKGAIPSFFTAKQKLPAVSDRKSPLLQRFAYFVPLYFMASSSGIVASKSTPYQGLSGFCRVTSMVWAV